MNKIQITDDYALQIKIGEQIYRENPKQYTEQRIHYINKTINWYMPDATAEEKHNAFFHSIYDYWVYGNDIEEEFFYGFTTMPHEEKKKYISLREKIVFIRQLNDPVAEKIFLDKYKTYRLLEKEYRREVIKVASEADYDEFCGFVDRHPTFFVKPSSLALGEGVYREKLEKWPGKKELFDHLLEKMNAPSEIQSISGGHLVLEEEVIQHEALAKLNASTVNIVRIATVLMPDDVKIAFAALRVGRAGKEIAGPSEGEIYCGVNPETGVVDSKGDTGNPGEIFVDHPDSHEPLLGFQIPMWDELIAMAKDVAKRVPDVRYVGWDFALSNRGWVVIEGNEHGDFLNQLVYKKPYKKEFEELIGYHIDKDFWWEY